MKTWPTTRLILPTLLNLWNRLKSNPTFVVLSGLFYGALGDTIFEDLQSGKLDLSRAGLHRIVVSAAGTAFVAWWHLHQPSPGSLASVPGLPNQLSSQSPSPTSKLPTPAQPSSATTSSPSQSKS